MRSAIVTGATGFIGSVFVETLVKNNIKVLALGRKSLYDLSESRRKRIKEAEYMQIDMSEIRFLPERIKSINWEFTTKCTFFNLAWGGAEMLSDLNVEAQMKNVSWSVDALKAAKLLGCNKFVQIGTMEEAFTYKYLDLDHNFNSEYNRHIIYSVAKIASKQALMMNSYDVGIDLIFANNSHVMGPDDDKDSFLQVTLQKLISKDELIFSTGEQLFDVISVKDCSVAYLLIGQNGKPGVSYWVGSGKPCKLRDYVERMYALYPSGKEMQFGKMPYNDIKLSKEDFCIENLVLDTGFKPNMSYEETVRELYKSFEDN